VQQKRRQGCEGPKKLVQIHLSNVVRLVFDLSGGTDSSLRAYKLFNALPAMRSIMPIEDGLRPGRGAESPR